VHAYTEGAWGADTGAADERQTGFVLSDARDPDRAAMVTAADALRIDLRARFYSRKWIEGMMDEGYAGADQIAVNVANSMGWKIMRPESISDDVGEEIVDIYLRDSKQLGVREWFVSENPYALQELTEVLLVVARKGNWEPSEEARRELAETYAPSIAQRGKGDGLRSGDNTKLGEFVRHSPPPSEAPRRAPRSQTRSILCKELRMQRRRPARPSSSLSSVACSSRALRASHRNLQASPHSPGSSWQRP